MAPWDELQYFELPSVQQFTSTQPNTVPVALQDPQRVWIAFTQGTSSSTIGVNIVPGPSTGGWNVMGNQPPPIFRARDDPGLVQSAWFANIGTGATLTVISIRLREWPRSNAVQRVGAPLPWERLARPQWPGGRSNGPDRSP